MRVDNGVPQLLHTNIVWVLWRMKVNSPIQLYLLWPGMHIYIYYWATTRQAYVLWLAEHPFLCMFAWTVQQSLTTDFSLISSPFILIYNNRNNTVWQQFFNTFVAISDNTLSAQLLRYQVLICSEWLFSAWQTTG